jgi:hypothetical protein
MYRLSLIPSAEQPVELDTGADHPPQATLEPDVSVQANRTRRVLVTLGEVLGRPRPLSLLPFPTSSYLEVPAPYAGDRKGRLRSSYLGGCLVAVTIFLCGHGAWSGEFFQLPQNCTMTFIVDVVKVLYTTDMYKVCGGTYTGQPARTIGARGSSTRSCPNMTWTADEPHKIVECNKRLKANPNAGNAAILFPNHLPNFLSGNPPSISLRKFFEDYWPTARAMVGQQEAHFVWNCCGYVNLKPSALGASLGVNAAMTAGEVHHIDFSGQDPVLTGKITSI